MATKTMFRKDVNRIFVKHKNKTKKTDGFLCYQLRMERNSIVNEDKTVIKRIDKIPFENKAIKLPQIKVSIIENKI
jgi:hypothetical protein